MNELQNKAVHGAVGVAGTVFAFMTPDRAGIAAGLATAAWMLWQLGASVYDRVTGRKNERHSKK